MSYKLNSKKILLYIAVATALSGCSSRNNIPEDIKLEYAGKDNLSKINDEWVSQEPSIQYIDRGGPLLISGPKSIPIKIKEMPIHADFAKGSTLSDLSSFFSIMGINFVIKNPEIANSEILIPGYIGSLGDFINILSIGHNISFSWHDSDTIVVDSSLMYVLKISQDEDIAKSISTELASLGALNISTSIQTGTVSYKASSEDQKNIISYLERSSLNTAMISMQVAIITVAMDKNRNTGIDWSALNLSLGNIPTADGSGGSGMIDPGMQGPGGLDPGLDP